jgi:peptide-methionine (S)-S-oxide reductase
VISAESGYIGGKTVNPTYQKVSTGKTGRTEAQRSLIEASKAALLKAGPVKVIHTEIAMASTFYPAEEYHQDYYKKNPIRYKGYRYNCGCDTCLAEARGSKK